MYHRKFIDPLTLHCDSGGDGCGDTGIKLANSHTAVGAGKAPGHVRYRVPESSNHHTTGVPNFNTSN